MNTEIRVGDKVRFPSGNTSWPQYLHARVIKVLRGELIVDRKGQRLHIAKADVRKLYEDITPF